MSKHVLILGGYGNSGMKIARLLLETTDARITLAAREMEKVLSAVKTLNTDYHTNMVSGIYADAAREETLLRALEGIDLIVVASGTARYTRIVAGAALKTGTDYLDLQFSNSKIVVLKSLAVDIAREGCCFITEAGFHPGLPAALVRYGSEALDRLESARVASVIQQNWKVLDVAISTGVEFVQELADFQSRTYVEGTWKKAGIWSLNDYPEFDFGEPFGSRRCAPMFLEELGQLPEKYPTMKQLGFYVAGFHPLVDWVVFPVTMVLAKVLPKRSLKSLSKFLFWSWKSLSAAPYGVTMQLECQGEKDNQPESVFLRLFHEDGYWFTAIPVVACIHQYLDGSIRKPGLWTMGNLVDPERLVHDLEQMGIRLTRERKLEN